MSYNNKLLNKFKLTGKDGFPTVGETEMTEMMSNPDYLRQSSALINDALKKGFDILQLADGGIVMTGVKTVIYQYNWDSEKEKLVRTTTKGKKLKKPEIKIDESTDA